MQIQQLNEEFINYLGAHFASTLYFISVSTRKARDTTAN